MSLDRRLRKLERRHDADDGRRDVPIETGGDLTPAEAAARRAEARGQAAPRGWVLEVVVPPAGGEEGGWARR